LLKITKFYKVFVLILLLVFSSALYGCSSDGASSSDSGSSSDEETVEITWLVRTDPNMIDWENEMIKQFEEQNPNIKIKLTQIPQEEIDQRLTTMIASGNVPDVWSANWANSGFAGYNQMGALLDLTPYIEKDPASIEGIPQEILDIYTIEGKNYGLPMLSIGSFLFYNKDLYDEAGLEYPTTDWEDTSWSWDKMVENAVALSNNTGNPDTQIYGVATGLAGNRHSWFFGGDFFSDEAYVTANMGTPNVVTPENIEAIQAHVDLIHKHEASPSQAALDSVSALGDPFLTGKVAMMINGGWGFWAYKPAEFNWGVAPIPYVEGREIPLFVDPWNISAKTKHPDEAWEFIKFLTAEDGGAKSFMEATSATPAREGLMDDWAQQMSDITGMSVEEIKQVNEGAFKYGRESDNHLIAKFAVVQTTINQTMTGILNGELSVEEGLEEIQDNLESLN
jgi:multiple sugar transport system substrate-binding protein